MSLPLLFAPSLVGRADQPALECDTPSGVRTFTFGDLDTRARRLAGVLSARGLRPGDRLAFCLANRLEVIDLWLACTRLGVIVVPINVLYKGREIGHIIGDAQPTAVVSTPGRAADLPAGTVLWDVAALAAEADRAGGEAGGARATTAAATDAPAAAAPFVATAETPAAIIYTSGTTGVAKGAVLTHGNFAANALALCAAWDITARDRYLAALPLFHVHGLGNGLHCWLVSGCLMKLVERFDREEALGWFEAFRPTLFFGVPTMYTRLLEADPARARAIGQGMRLFVSGSAPLPVAVLEEFRARYGHVILERYGMTETLMNASNPLAGERRPGAVGPALPMTAVEVRDPEGHALPDGQVGELWVRGPNVCAGYWRWPEATQQAFRDGWFRTGDIGVRSADGYLTLQGRRSDLIISGGFNIYPREIEELLCTLPGVREAAVVGEADPVRGEVPVAYVVGDADPAALEAQVRAALASFKVPRRWVRLDALPRTALGKVQKHLLAARA